METRPFGKTNMQVSVLGLGASGSAFEEEDRPKVKQLLESALDAGLNVIDTGECYRGSEELIGETISHRRKDFYLFTKCGHPHGMESAANWSKDSILESIQRSLRRLKTQQVDLVHLHSCSEKVLRDGEAITALQTARERGYTRYLGYSGDSHAARYAVECGAFDSLQTSINIADQEAIDLVLPLASEKKMGVMAKRPIANVAWKARHKPAHFYHKTYWERLRKLNYPFLHTDDVEKGVAIALRFTLTVPGVHLAVVGTMNPERCRQNVGLLKAGPLDQEEFHRIRERWNTVAPRTWIGQT